MASEQEITCLCGCGRKKMVRVADVKRGWGKYYNKACKARHQARVKGRGRGRGRSASRGSFVTLRRALDEGRISMEYYADVVTTDYPEHATAEDWVIAVEGDVHPFSSEGLGQW